MDNKATLIGYYGGDTTHCLSAWQSTNVELEFTQDINTRTSIMFAETAKNKKKNPQELLAMLAQEGHETPFEKSALHFQLTADIASHIHCLKRRIGTSVNCESARYKELEDKLYVPDDWHSMPVSPKAKLVVNQLVDVEYSVTWGDVLSRFGMISHELYHAACEDITEKLGRKRAKESARYFLPYAKQLDYDMMFNFRSFIHFQRLRNTEHAQVEIREIAQSMLEQVQAIPGNPFKYSLQAFGLPAD